MRKICLSPISILFGGYIGIIYRNLFKPSLVRLAPCNMLHGGAEYSQGGREREREGGREGKGRGGRERE